MRRRTPGLWLILAILASSSRITLAASVETLVMPGPVIDGHAKYETQCTKCHARLSKTTQTQLCLDCHEDVAKDLDAGNGYHGRIADIANTECRSCHGEHKGRKADVVQLDPIRFDHGATDFQLEGGHLKAKCSACHEADRKFREAPSKCFDCHEQDDPHKGRLAKTCGDCHDETGWKKSQFDHDKTDYPLEGRHQKVSCNSCHPNERYKNSPKECYACHALNDVHAGRYGTKCETCHAPEKWTATEFDHDRETDFPLENRHRDVACGSCHKGRLGEEKLETNCYGCHRNDDEHKGRNGRKCDSCHSTRGWDRIGFDHAEDTKFPLHGKHDEIACTACHRGDVYKDKLETGCNSCHGVDDVHKGQEGTKCERCHDERGWGGKVAFDHGLTRFPLIGLHAAAPCEECHLSAAFKDANLECDSCHSSEDVHKGALSTQCESCHNPNGWKLWRFDHDSQTDFRLDGSHKDLVCGSCHTKAAGDKVRQAQTCNACHQTDDVHRGRFGRNCERCHDTEDFKKIRLGR